jgi:hypothetical protein
MVAWDAVQASAASDPVNAALAALFGAVALFSVARSVARLLRHNGQHADEQADQRCDRGRACDVVPEAPGPR